MTATHVFTFTTATGSARSSSTNTGARAAGGAQTFTTAPGYRYQLRNGPTTYEPSPRTRTMSSATRAADMQADSEDDPIGQVG